MLHFSGDSSGFTEIVNNLGRFLLIFFCVSIALANVSCGLINFQVATEDMHVFAKCHVLHTFSFCPLRDFVDPCQFVSFDVHVLAGRLKFCCDTFWPAFGTLE